MRRRHRTRTTTYLLAALVAILPLRVEAVLADDLGAASILTDSSVAEPSDDPPDDGGEGVDGDGDGGGGNGGDGDEDGDGDGGGGGGGTPSPSPTPTPPSPTPTPSPSPSPDPVTSPGPGGPAADPPTSARSMDTKGPAPAAPSAVKNREGGAVEADALEPDVADGSAKRDASRTPVPVPTSSLRSLTTGDAPVIDRARFATRLPPPDEPGRLALLVIIGLALTLLPYVFHKARQEWRS
jgi:hypothetical protein